MPVSEQKVQKEIIDYLESNNCYVVKITRAGKVGTPDLLVCVPYNHAVRDGYVGSLFVGLEVKAYGKKKNLTKLQEHHLALIRASGGFADVVDSVLDVELLLGEYFM